MREYLFVGDDRYLGPEPMELRLHANFYIDAAETLIHHGRKTVPASMSAPRIALLICHAMELLLKLGLYKHGYSEKEILRPKLRHDLIALKDECCKCGITFSNEVSEVIQYFGPFHVEHRFRYNAKWYGWTPKIDLCQAIDASRRLIMISHPTKHA